MNTILESIVKHKRIEIQNAKSKVSEQELTSQEYYNRSCHSLGDLLRNPSSSGIISEFKRKSPSKGWIHQNADVTQVVQSYHQAGVSGLSCLTDEYFFGASCDDFQNARLAFEGPILRKDFIIDTYQIHQSKAIGADVILLIAAILTKEQIIQFTDVAHGLGLEVLLELHHIDDIEKHYKKVDITGINNRDLHDFSVSLLTSIDLKRRLPKDTLVISESGLDHPGIVADLYHYGFKGFLIGEYFMKYGDPGKTALDFVTELQKRKFPTRA